MMPTYAKAIASLVSTFLAGLAVALTGQGSGFGDVTDGQWVALVSASLAAALVVYGVRNGPSTDPTTSTPQLGPPDVGAGELGIVITVLVIIVLVLIVLRLT